MNLLEVDSPEFREALSSIKVLREELKLRETISRFEISNIDPGRLVSSLNPALAGRTSKDLFSDMVRITDRVYGNDGIGNAPGFVVQIPNSVPVLPVVPPVVGGAGPAPEFPAAAPLAESLRPISQRNIDASVAFVHKSLMDFDSVRQIWTVRGDTVGNIHGICESEESFFHEFSCAYASGALVGKKAVLTARHVIREAFGIADFKVVFGFEQAADGTARREFGVTDVYTPERILAENLGLGVDWALLMLDRDVEGREPVEVRESGKIEDNAPLYAIGYPLGVMKKATGGAVVRDNSGEGFFVSNLDVFDSNSGSLVCNAIDDRLEGIHVAGAQDFVEIVEDGRRCKRIVKFESDLEGTGETVTRISEVAKFVDFASLR